LRHDGTANDLARTVRDLLQTRNIVETPDPAAAERLLMIAPAGNGWLMVFDHVEAPSLGDADALLAELSRTAGTLALDIMIADSDDLILTLMDASPARNRPWRSRKWCIGGLGTPAPARPVHR
jgi:hypothetical protein